MSEGNPRAKERWKRLRCAKLHMMPRSRAPALSKLPSRRQHLALHHCATSITSQYSLNDLQQDSDPSKPHPTLPNRQNVWQSNPHHLDRALQIHLRLFNLHNRRLLRRLVRALQSHLPSLRTTRRARIKTRPSRLLQGQRRQPARCSEHLRNLGHADVPCFEGQQSRRDGSRREPLCFAVCGSICGGGCGSWTGAVECFVLWEGTDIGGGGR